MNRAAQGQQSADQQISRRPSGTVIQHMGEGRPPHERGDDEAVPQHDGCAVAHQQFAGKNRDPLAQSGQQLVELDDGALGLVEEMYQIFRDDTPSRIKALGEAIQAGNLTEMGDVAHAIKGASATMGAPRVRSVALALETAGRKGVGEVQPAELFPILEAEFQKALEGLESFIASRR